MRTIALFFSLYLSTWLFGQARVDYKSWTSVALRSPAEWYATPEASAVAERVLIFQTPEGGWPKNISFQRVLSQEEVDRLRSSKKGMTPTIDNGATVTEIRFLTAVYRATRKERYGKAALDGIEYLLRAQYETNGGWPQFYPLVDGYYTHITYNDDAIYRVLRLEEEILGQDGVFDFVPEELKVRVQKSFDRGVDCILRTQIRKAGALTVWCAQHDEKTLLPASARAYELESFSAQEGANLVLLLMDIKRPSDAVKAAVEGAVEWFAKHQLRGVEVKEQLNAAGEKDRVLVVNPKASALWARFYDLETEKPFFCDRDGVKLSSIAELSYERRVGYSWYTKNPQKVLNRYAKWRAQHDRRPTLYTIGDSTMSEKDTTKGSPEWGWMMAFRSLVDTTKLRIVNLAQNGRSTKSFREQGFWSEAYNNLRQGDFVFVQFGHNDSKVADTSRYTEPKTTFRDNLIRYLSETRRKGATPILFTSIARRQFESNGRISNHHGDYVRLIPAIAADQQVEWIDLFSRSKALYESYGNDRSQTLFINLPPNTNPNYPKGLKDNTHLNQTGAMEIARIVVAELRTIGSPLISYLR